MIGFNRFTPAVCVGLVLATVEGTAVAQSADPVVDFSLPTGPAGSMLSFSEPDSRGLNLSLGPVGGGASPVARGPRVAPYMVPRPQSHLYDGAGQYAAIRELERIAEEVESVDLSRQVGAMNVTPLLMGRELEPGHPRHDGGLTGVDLDWRF